MHSSDGGTTRSAAPESKRELVAEVSVAQVLALPVIRAGSPRVIAGHDHLDRPVRWVHSTDLAGVPPTLNGGELVLTTGAGLGPRPGAQRRYLGELASAGAAGLIVELGETLTEFRSEAQLAAQELELPVIVLHRPVRFVDVTEAVQSEIINSRYAVLKWGEDIQSQMFALLLKDEGIPAVLDCLADVVHSPVFLETSDHQLLYYAEGPDPDVASLDLWAGMRVALVAGDEVDGLVAADVPFGEGEQPGRLLAARADGTLTDLAAAAVERAAPLIALTLLRARQAEELARRGRGNFLFALARGRITAADAERNARAFGLESNLRLMLPLAVEVRHQGGVDEPGWQDILERIEAGLTEKAIQIVIGSDRPGAFLAIAGVVWRADRATIAEAVAAVTRSAVSSSLGEAEVAIVIGESATWPQIGSSLQLAADGAASAFALPEQPWHDLHTLEAERLLWRLRDDEELQALVDRTLGELLEHDEQNSNKLMPTLEALLTHGGRKSDAARALHLNRQALYGRLRRIHELVGLDLEHADQRLILHLAVHARRQMLARR